MPIRIHTGLYVSNLLLYNHIEKFVQAGMKKGADATAQLFVELARENLSAAIEATGGHETGNLANNIYVVGADTGLANYARTDIKVNNAKGAAPYALWVEWGINAGKSVPANIKESKFKGHKYLTKTLKTFREGGAEVLAAKYIIKSLMSARSVSGLKKLV